MRAPLVLRRGLVLVDHLPHPDRLAAEIEIVGAGCDAGREQLVAVELIRADGGDDRFGLVDHRLQRGGIAGIGHDQRRIRGRADRVAHGFELVEAAPGHRPFQLLVVLVMRGEIFGDELAGESGRAIDDDVEFLRQILHLDCIRDGRWTGLHRSFARDDSSVTRPCRRGRRSGCHRARSDSAGRSWPVASCRRSLWRGRAGFSAISISSSGTPP